MDWKERLSLKKILIADGGWGTQFMKRGLAQGESPELWNTARPDDVRAIAQAYAEAGADIILTNSFGGSRIKLAHSGAQDRVVELNRAAARLSKEAAGDRALVFGSVGPTGEFMEPLGELTEEQMIDIFAEQVRALAEGGVDGFVLETMTALEEARCALLAVRRETKLPVVVSMTYDCGPAGFATMMGVTPAKCAAEFTALSADLIGANCGAGSQRMVEIVKALAAETTLSVWAKPNAGLPQLIDGNTVYGESPDDMATSLPALVNAGAKVIGGCCGSTPDHIRRMVQARNELIKSMDLT